MIYEKIKSGAGFDFTFYAYLAVIIVFAILSIVVQWRYFANEDLNK